MCGAKHLGIFQLARQRVHRNDALRASQGCALNDVQPHPATANHHHAGPRLYLGRPQRCPDARGHTTANQGRLRHGHVGVNAHQTPFRHHAVFGKGRDTGKMFYLLITFAQPGGAIG